MDTIASFDGTPIAYTVEGHGPPVLLLHGFAADHHANWVEPGIVNALIGAERQVIATDARGHGRSGKPHDPSSYAGDAMVRDAQAVLDHLGVTEVDVVGYSMGAMVSARLVSVDPRARSVVLGGVGGNLMPPEPAEGQPRIADALEAEDPSTIHGAVARAFRAFADRTGADRLALAAIERSTSLRYPVDFAAITVPALVLVGDADALVGSPQAPGRATGRCPGGDRPGGSPHRRATHRSSPRPSRSSSTSSTWTPTPPSSAPWTTAPTPDALRRRARSSAARRWATGSVGSAPSATSRWSSTTWAVAASIVPARAQTRSARARPWSAASVGCQSAATVAPTAHSRAASATQAATARPAASARSANGPSGSRAATAPKRRADSSTEASSMAHTEASASAPPARPAANRRPARGRRRGPGSSGRGRRDAPRAGRCPGSGRSGPGCDGPARR